MNGVQGAVSDLLLGSVGHSKSNLYMCTKLSDLVYGFAGHGKSTLYMNGVQGAVSDVVCGSAWHGKHGKSIIGPMHVCCTRFSDSDLRWLLLPNYHWV